MINRLIELSLRNRFIVVALYLGLAAWGWWALGSTPIDAIPDLSDNQVIVFTDWPGHSPQEVEDQVAYPLTVNLQGPLVFNPIRRRARQLVLTSSRYPVRYPLDMTVPASAPNLLPGPAPLRATA